MQKLKMNTVADSQWGGQVGKSKTEFIRHENWRINLNFSDRSVT